MSSMQTRSKPRSIGPYNRAFRQNLIDGGIYPNVHQHHDDRIPAKPKNWKEINDRLARCRSSLSPSKFSEEAHEKFKRAAGHAYKEPQVSSAVIPIIEGEIRDARCVSGGIPFANLDHLTDGRLTPGNPDRYYVRNELSKYIIPTTEEDLPILPNFFLATKGRDGSPAVADRSACYDGALGARGMQSLRSYGQDEIVYDDMACVISSIYQHGHLMIYTSHPSRPTGPMEKPEIFMTQCSTWSMCGDVETFRQGATAFRNARDWASEQRNEAIRLANERTEHNRAQAQIEEPSEGSSTTATIPGDGTSTYEPISNLPLPTERLSEPAKKPRRSPKKPRHSSRKGKNVRHGKSRVGNKSVFGTSSKPGTGAPRCSK
ncbi:hypothetical protein MMC29_002160 [Sticta canariensis]|nr:hypothetical protein [Sticta canariensis]